ncbi:hypothetical protein ACI2KS_29425 [Pseudomonas sp. NPDC087358]|uniref:hypothetical protein n=1 Tax=Pseudomonas sp. NPDC087358 TaxID=3364439 RepID=UPI00384CD1E2
MRWVVLLLVMLNAFYYVWHQQEAPLRPKEVAPVSLYKSAQPGIRLLSESKGQSSDAAGQAVADACLYLGGEIPRSDAKTIEQRLISLDIQTQFGRRQDEFGGVYWLKVEPESRRLVDDALLAGLKQDFPQLKSKIMSCEGIATSD